MRTVASRMRATAHLKAGVLRVRLAFPGSRPLPHFLIIGGQKCGTTSLHAYLAEHRDVIAPVWKEAHFFDLHWERGVEWYRGHFPTSASTRRGDSERVVTGDSSPYYIYHPHVPKRVSAVLPSARLIALLREPAARAYSHYHHEVRAGREGRTFSEAIDNESSWLPGETLRLEQDPSYYSERHHRYAYVDRGVYEPQLRRWLEHFPPEQILVLKSESLFERPNATLARVRDFLGLAPGPKIRSRPRNRAAYPRPEPATMRLLQRFYAAPNRALAGLLEDWPGAPDIASWS